MDEFAHGQMWQIYCQTFAFVSLCIDLALSAASVITAAVVGCRTAGELSGPCNKGAVPGTSRMGYSALLCLTVTPSCTNTVLLRLVSCSGADSRDIAGRVHVTRLCRSVTTAGLRSIPGLSMWDLLSIQWHCEISFGSVFPLSGSQHQCSTLVHSRPTPCNVSG